MNKLTTIVAAGLLLGAGLSFSTTVYAQAPGTTPPSANTPATAPATTGRHHESQIQKLTEELNLTPAEVANITPIIDTARAKIKAIREDATLTPDQQKAEIGPIRKQENKDIDAQLTPDQNALQKSLRKNHGLAPTPAQAPTTN